MPGVPPFDIMCVNVSWRKSCYHAPQKVKPGPGSQNFLILKKCAHIGQCNLGIFPKFELKITNLLNKCYKAVN
jgi:hypothetical protein